MGKTIDVAICGGGLAGLCLARQLRMRFPELSILVADKIDRPLPSAAFKVGESTFSGGAYYLDHVLGLHDYMEAEQVPKLGLRYFFTDPALRGREVDFAACPELGRSRFADYVPEWQVDRGKLERDLRQMLVDAGVELLEGCAVKSIDLRQDQPHRVELLHRDVPRTVEARWVVDATGRRKMIQKALDLGKKMSKHHLPGAPAPDAARHSAVWWRVGAELRAEEIVDASDKEWQDRTVDPAKRYHATIHFVGTGYWVWLIPLPDGNHSVGIVFDEAHVGFDEVREYERAMAWMRVHQPEVAELVGRHEPLDFMLLRNYSYSCKLAISSDRWACTGDAAGFADPYQSPGTTSISYLNCQIVQCIAEDFAGTLEDGKAEERSDEWVDWLEDVNRGLQRNYRYFDRPVVKSASILFQTALAGMNIPLFHSFRYRPGFLGGRSLSDDDAFLRRYARARQLQHRFEALLEEWYASTAPSTLSFGWIDYQRSVPILDENLKRGWGEREIPLERHFDETFEVLEAMAVALVRVAVDDVRPDLVPRIKDRALNPWALSLSPERWEAEGLFDEPIGFRRRLDPTKVAEVSADVRALYRRL
jgi:flavin-dependent dehydrogenase